MTLEAPKNAEYFSSENFKLSTSETSQESSRAENLAASVYLNYFQTHYDEKVLDSWFKVYMPLIKEDSKYHKVKRL